jgi:hypothetical protein
MIVLGVDPGASYTAAVVRDDDELLLASTFKRPEGMPPVTWAMACVRHVREILAQYPQIKLVGVEGIQAPRGFSNGKISMIQPGPLIFMAMVLGAVVSNLDDTHSVVIVPAKKNGAGDADSYPAALNGKRPKDLPGSNNAGTRRHEKSAWDIAGEVELLFANNYHLDAVKEL